MKTFPAWIMRLQREEKSRKRIVKPTSQHMSLLMMKKQNQKKKLSRILTNLKVIFGSWQIEVTKNITVDILEKKEI